MTSGILRTAEQAKADEVSDNSKQIFGRIIQTDQYVGDVYSIGYESALVLIHDYYRKQVGGIPSLSFLIATRLNLSEPIDFRQEDASVILLRVMDSAPLPNADEAERVRVETAQRVSGQWETHWDSPNTMDASTNNLLSFAGVKCRVIGTFFLEKDPRSLEEDTRLVLRFGDDISNYYPNRGLKVFKPNDRALAAIVNYRDAARFIEKEPRPFPIGKVRYASTNRAFQGVSDVEVEVIPDDLLGQKTAIFGMTRTGKSNTTKIILQSVFQLRFQPDSQRIGQLVFDPNGEYANDNVQDKDGSDNPDAIRNVWKTNVFGNESDVVTYGLLPHPNDPKRKLMLLNFYEDENLQIGKEIIDASLATDSSKYIQNFRQVVFDPPANSDRSAMTRYHRRVLAYRALLVKAGFQAPKDIDPITKRLFNQKLLTRMRESGEAEFVAAANMFSDATPKWSQLSTAFESLEKFMKTPSYKAFENDYVGKKEEAAEVNETEPDEAPEDEGTWADDDLKKILTMYAYPNGSRLIAKVRNQHTTNTSTDYAEDIYNDLVDGRLVIVDQASGDPLVNRASADRIMWYIFSRNQDLFRAGKEPHKVLIYIEEAHNLLPAGSDMDLQDVWVRTAKEGAKYNIGMVYATQEVSSVQKNILKNTANWLIGHLNNTDETKELCKYYDFADFEMSIRRAQDRGFLRIKTLSNRFVIPVQIKKFEVGA